MKHHLMALRYFRLTSAGWLYLLVTLGVGMAGVNAGNNLLYLITAMLLSSLIVSGILSKLVISRLNVKVDFPLFLFANSQGELSCQLRNDKLFFSSYGLVFFSSHPGIQENFFFVIPPKSKVLQKISFTPQKRGAYSLPFYVKTGFPFGLVEKSLFLSTAEGVVFPELLVQHRELRNLFSHSFGEESSAYVGGPGDFYELRPYQEGEEARRIFWRFFAKWEKPMVREGERESRRGWVVRLVTEANPHPQALEEALSLCTTAIYTLFRRGKPVGLCANQRFFQPSSALPDVRAMLTYLALFEPESASSYSPPFPCAVHIRVTQSPQVQVEGHVA